MTTWTALTTLAGKARAQALGAATHSRRGEVQALGKVIISEPVIVLKQIEKISIKCVHFSLVAE